MNPLTLTDSRFEIPDSRMAEGLAFSNTLESEPDKTSVSVTARTGSSEGLGGCPSTVGRGELGSFWRKRAAFGRSERVENEQFHSFSYGELVARDKANLDITWLRDDSLEDLNNLPVPEVIAREIVEDLTAALAEFEAVAAALEASAGVGPEE